MYFSYSSLHKNFTSARGHGLVLIDFGRAVDLTAFSADILFQGSNETDGFQCTQMLEGKPWKYEVLHVLDGSKPSKTIILKQKQFHVVF